MMHIEGYNIHPLAQKAPEMTPEEYRQLKESIQKIGQTHPITVDKDGTLLEGRHRLKAALELGIAPKTETYNGEQTIAQFIFSTNIRRNLSKAQRHQYIADFAPIIYKEVEAKTKEAQKRKTASGAFVREESSRTTLVNANTEHPGRDEVKEKMGITEWEARLVKDVINHAPDLLPEVGKIGNLHKAAIEAKKRSGGKSKKKGKGLTPAEVRKRHAALLSQRTQALTNEQIDPDFQGTEQEFTRKYGYVRNQTKQQLEEAADKQAFSSWVASFRALKKPLEAYLALGTFRVDNFRNYLSKGASSERRKGEMKELVDMIIRTRESIEWLIRELNAEVT